MVVERRSRVVMRQVVMMVIGNRSCCRELGMMRSGIDSPPPPLPPPPFSKSGIRSPPPPPFSRSGISSPQPPSLPPFPSYNFTEPEETNNNRLAFSRPLKSGILAVLLEPDRPTQVLYRMPSLPSLSKPIPSIPRPALQSQTSDIGGQTQSVPVPTALSSDEGAGPVQGDDDGAAEQPW
ncbi:hypothetical protein M0R45_035513 [Rubus argutus]|uniref:Uncharacterized protein n=1 Tax=Rubus argutus TaxID=59490 RepID=A0AAW1VXU9_RUBAR